MHQSNPDRLWGNSQPQEGVTRAGAAQRDIISWLACLRHSHKWGQRQPGSSEEKVNSIQSPGATPPSMALGHLGKILWVPVSLPICGLDVES